MGNLGIYLEEERDMTRSKFDSGINTLLDTTQQLLDDTLSIAKASKKILDWYDTNFSSSLDEIENLRVAVDKLGVNAKESLRVITEEIDGRD
jgi:hypothetical protein